MWFDGSGYQLAPEAVIGCATVAQDRLVYERVKAMLDGEKPYGKADIVGARDGYVGFDPDGPAYRSPCAAIRAALRRPYRTLRKGSPDFTLTSF